MSPCTPLVGVSHGLSDRDDHFTSPRRGSVIDMKENAMRPILHALAPFALACAATGAAAAVPVAPSPAATVGLPAATVSASTSFFYSTYQRYGANILWITCGHDATSSGCYGSGDLGPFGRPCALAGDGRNVVVADASPANPQQTLLSFYKRTESARPAATLARTVAVAIPASATATCHLAVRGNLAWFGTSASPTFYKVDLTTGTATAGSTCGGNTSAVTGSDKVVVVSQTDCFSAFALSGALQEDGGQVSDTDAAGIGGASF